MSSPVRDALRFERVDIVFGRKPEENMARWNALVETLPKAEEVAA